MAALDVKMILSLVDKASGPARGIMGRIFGRNGRGPVGALERTGATAAVANNAMMSLNRSIMLFGATAGAAVGFKAMIGNAIEFETSMANVRKLVSGTPAQLIAIEAAIKKISRESPIASNDMAALVAQAGQFGIPTDDLVEFAKFAAKASVAFDIDPATTGEKLSQMRNALGLTMDQLKEYGDAINYVADRNGSSEEQLIDFALRTGAGAKAAGLDPKDLLAIGSAMTEVGLTSQRAATATNSMLAKLGMLTKKKATVAVLDKIGGKGYSARLQKKFFDTPREAMIDILQLSKKMSRPDRASLFFNLFGLETSDEANALAGNIDKVIASQLELADTSKYLGSIQKTYGIFSATTAAQWKQFTGNIEMASAAMGSKLLPSINGGLEYLNLFFATAEGRIDIFTRLGTAADGFFSGMGYKGGTGEALASMTAGLTAIRDLLFGIEGDEAYGEGTGRIFERFRKLGDMMKNSPISTIFESIKGANVAELGGGLTAAAFGFGALAIAAKIALSPLRLIFGVMKGLVKTAYLLSGLRTAKWLFDLAAGGGGKGATAATAAATGATLGGLMKTLAKASPWLAMLTLSGDTPKDKPAYVPTDKDWDDMTRIKGYDRQGPSTRGGRRAPPPTDPNSMAGSGDFEAYFGAGGGAAGMDAAKAKAAETGAAMQSSLNVTATPVVDTSSMDNAIAKARELLSILASAGAASAGVNAGMGAKVSGALRQTLSDGAE